MARQKPQYSIPEIELLPIRATSRVEREILIGLQSFYLNSEVNHLLFSNVPEFTESVRNIGNITRKLSDLLYGGETRKRLTYLHLQEKAIKFTRAWLEENAQGSARKRRYPSPYTGNEYGL